MPVYTIETPGGRTLDIEAADESAALRGAQQWDAEQSKGTGQKVVEEVLKTPKRLAHGVSGMAKGFGATSKALGGSGETADAVGDGLAPSNYESASERFLQPQAGDATVAGFGVGSLPGAVVETVPGIAADVTAAGIGAKLGKFGGVRGRLIGGALGGIASYAGRAFGNNVQEAADKRTGTPGAELTKPDYVSGGLGTAGAAAVNLIPTMRFLGKAGGKAGSSAGAELTKKAALEGVTEPTQSIIEQGATSFNAPGGPSVDLHRALGEGIIGMGAGGTFAAPRAAVDANNARRFKDIDPESAARVAERANKHAAGENQQKGGVAFDATQATETDIFTDLAAALETDPELKAAIDQNADARRAFEHVKRREKITDSALADISNAVAGKQNALVINELVQDARTVSRLKEKGSFDESAKAFTGGLSTPLDKGLRFVRNPAAALATTGAGIYGLGAYSPHAVGILGGVYGGTRLIDKFTGYRSPLKTFTDRFSKDGTRIRNPIAAPPEEVEAAQEVPQAPAAPPPRPWGPRPVQTVPEVPLAPEAVPAAPMAPPGPTKWDLDIEAKQLRNETLRNNREFSRLRVEKAQEAREAKAAKKATDQATEFKGLLDQHEAAKKVREASAAAPIVNPQVDIPTPVVNPQVDTGPVDAIPDFLRRTKDNKVPAAKAAAGVKKVAAAHTKKDDTKKADVEEDLPEADYWHMEPEEVAKMRVDQKVAEGQKIMHVANYKAHMARRLAAERQIFFDINDDLPELADRKTAKPYLARMWGAKDQASAKKVRARMERDLPEHVDMIRKHFTDEKIQTLWKHQ